MRISDLEFRRVLFRSREPGGIDLQPVALSEVNHVQRHHQRQGELLQLQNEAKVIVAVRRVDHRNDGIRAALSRLTAHPDIVRHLRVGSSEARRVGQECFSTCRSRWSPYHSKKPHTMTNNT